jgi:acyl-homoserine lactone acylase PvdQ
VRNRLAVLLVAGLCGIALVAAPAAAAPAPQPYGTNDFGGFRDVLPPGTNGRATAADIAAFGATGRRPPHNDDQLNMYASLVRRAPNLTTAEIPSYFKDATFGVKAGEAERTYSPRSDVTIVRDRPFGVPHVYGSTRGGAMFGLGYIAAEDRLFFIDVLRHLGRAQLSSFVGGAPGNRELDHEQWVLAPYTEADLQAQVDQLDNLYGAEGARIQADAADYVAGVNQYVNEARLDPTKMPGEYAAIGKPAGPDPWKTTDLIATASLVGGIFGKGGGRELTQAELVGGFWSRFGFAAGTDLWRDFRSAEDPEAPTTVHNGQSFPYQVPPAQAAAGSIAIHDAGTLRRVNPVESSSGAGGPGGPSPGPVPLADQLAALRLPRVASNALLVSAAESTSGRPLAVFGPQTGYFAPQILMEQDVHAPGIDARGAAFPGVNLYVQLGHGRDYAWSATSAGQDIIDTFAVDLCEPGGGTATVDSTSYMFRGRCTAMDTVRRTNTWTPNAADQTPPGSETLRADRTKLGIVIARARIGGRPVAFTSLRSTYFHEVDSARGFADFNDPAKIRNPQAFQLAAAKIGYTFNWFYADDRHIAYFNSGNNPVRADGVDHNWPVRAQFEWKSFNPDLNTASYTPFAQHPQAIDQDYLTSWNNKQAPGYRGADTNVFTSVYRSQPLDDRIRAAIAGTRKMSRVELVNAMEDAATVDLRADKVLPTALTIIGGNQSDPAVRDAVNKLFAWIASGSHRRDLNGDGAYEHSDAIRILDAWWPRWIKAQFEPVLGAALFEQLTGAIELDNAPNNHGAHLGSAYQTGWYGYADKDLRSVLGRTVRGAYHRKFCGGGDLAACRTALVSSLKEALGVPASTLYADDTCSDAGQPASQTCFDKISFRPLGAITQPLIPWVNRPTYQQVVEVQGHGPR